jgi:hypothetical protein
MIGEIRLLGDSSSELPEDFAIPEDFFEISEDFRRFPTFHIADPSCI